MITLEAFQYVKTMCEVMDGSFDVTLDRHGLSSEAFYRRVAKQFDFLKENFMTAGSLGILVRGPKSKIGNGVVAPATFEFTR